MFLEPTVLSLLVAKLRRGRFSNFKNVYIKGWYLLIISASIQGSLSIIKKIDTPWGDKLLTEYLIYGIMISYILMITAIILNIKKNHMKIFLIGIILNFIVIMGNGGQMPVSLEGLKGIHTETILPDRGFDIKHRAVTKDTRFVYLGDIILLSKPYPLPKILSIGDIFLMLGTFMFFQEEMLSHKKKSISQVS